MPNVNEAKKMGIAGVLLCSAMLVIAPAMAQDTPPPPPAQGDAQGPPPGGRGGGMMNPERRLEMMQKQLGLSPEQSTAIKSILDDEQTKMQAMQSDTSMSRDDRRSKMMAMREDEKTKVEAVLTKDQKPKYEEMEAKMRERTQRGGGDGPPPPPPPPQ
jgi:periplasmic protein CpxP/Spy